MDKRKLVITYKKENRNDGKDVYIAQIIKQTHRGNDFCPYTMEGEKKVVTDKSKFVYTNSEGKVFRLQSDDNPEMRSAENILFVQGKRTSNNNKTVIIKEDIFPLVAETIVAYNQLYSNNTLDEEDVCIELEDKKWTVK